jgi:hypothetical protein
LIRSFSTVEEAKYQNKQKSSKKESD